jgi:hypothetical protein
MRPRFKTHPLFLLSCLLFLLFLPVIAACDPEYSLCVVATSCLTDLPLAGAHVRVQAYDVDGITKPDGMICIRRLDFPDPFEIVVDAPGYLAKMDGPFKLGNPGTTDFRATVCLEPQP